MVKSHLSQPWTLVADGDDIVAGCCFSDERERKQTVKLLEDIEVELGWAAKYRVQALYQQWGAPPG